jgi:hypothetical protein
LLRHESSAVSNETNAPLMPSSRSHSTAGHLAQHVGGSGEPSYGGGAISRQANYGQGQGLAGHARSGLAPSNLGPTAQQQQMQMQMQQQAQQQQAQQQQQQQQMQMQMQQYPYPYGGQLPPDASFQHVQARLPRIKLQASRAGGSKHSGPASSPLAKLHSPQKSGTGRPRGRPPKQKNIVTVLAAEAGAAAAAAAAAAQGTAARRRSLAGAHAHELGDHAAGVLQALHSQMGHNPHHQLPLHPHQHHHQHPHHHPHHQHPHHLHPHHHHHPHPHQHMEQPDHSELEPLHELPLDHLDAALGQGLGGHFAGHSAEQW